MVEKLCQEIISLPMYVGLKETDIEQVGKALLTILAKDESSWMGASMTASKQTLPDHRRPGFIGSNLAARLVELVPTSRCGCDDP